MVIPTVSEELLAFSRNVEMFQAKDIKVAVSNEKSILIANNKGETYNFFKNKPYCPQIYTAFQPHFPCVVKPCDSRGSRGFYICKDDVTLKSALETDERQFGKSLIMEYLQGDEFSVYGLSDLNGTPLLSIANKRIKARGESTVAEVVANHTVCDLSKSIASQLGLVGPWNVQLMGSSCFKIVEVNPRIAGSASLIIAAGIAYIDLIIKVFTNQKILPQELNNLNGNLFMIRYNEEIFVKPENIHQ